MLTDPIVIEIDGKAVPKGRGRVGMVAGHATVFTPAHTRKYENLIRIKAMEAMAGRNPIDGAVEVFVHVYLSFPKSASKKKLAAMALGNIRPCVRPDLDNFLKSACDGMNTIVFHDDNQVVSLHAYKWYRLKPAMRIEVRECFNANVKDVI